MTRLRFLFALLILPLLGGSLQAQYGHEWINFAQTYYKFRVPETGIYRVSYTDLQTVGYPVGSVDPRNLQVWRRGQQMAIKFSGESDGTFDPGDYLEFYGEKNDGTLDSLLYRPASRQPHPYLSLYSDTSAYFLTEGSTTGLRVPLFNEITALPLETYRIEESLQLFFADYSFGQKYGVSILSQWDEAESYCGPVVSKGFSSTNTFTGLSGVVGTGPSPTLEVQMVGRNEQVHVIDIQTGSGGSQQTTAVPNWSAHRTQTTIIGLNFTQLASGSLPVTMVVNGNGASADAVSLTYLKLTYPRNFDLSGALQTTFKIPANASDTARFRLVNAPTGAEVYDVTNPYAARQLATTNISGTLEVVLPDAGTVDHQIMVIAASQRLSPAQIVPTTFSVDTVGTPNFLMIGHSSLMSAAQNYEAYRESAAGGSYEVLLADINRLYDQYTYGERNPIALRRFSKFLYDNEASIDYLMILGKGLTAGTFGPGGFFRFAESNPGWVYRDLVPVLGVPGSDMEITLRFQGADSLYPAIPTGRVPANSNAELQGYLDKVITHESTPYDVEWRKRILHLSGGNTGNEPATFLSFMNSYKAIAEGPLLGGTVRTYTRETSTQQIEVFNVSEDVNAGLLMITYFGHSSTFFGDITIGDVSNPVFGYNNPGKYTFFLVNGCAYGNFFGLGSQGEDWCLTASKGAIGTIGNTDLGFASQFHEYSTDFYTYMFADSLAFLEGLGDIHQRCVRDFINTKTSNNTAIAFASQMNLQGDPSLRMFAAPLPDYAVTTDGLFLQSFQAGQPITAVTDSFELGIVVNNYGQYYGTSEFSICVDRTYNNGQDTDILGPFFFTDVRNLDTLFITIRSADPTTFGQNTFTVTVECSDVIDELDELNNTASLDYYIPLAGVNPLFPANYSIVGSSPVDLVAQSADLLTSSTTGYVLELDTSYQFDSPVVQTTTLVGTDLVTWSGVTLPVTTDSTVYYWRVRYQTIPFGSDTLWGDASFTYLAGKSGWALNSFEQYFGAGAINMSRDLVTERFEYDTVETFLEFSAGGQFSDPLSTIIRINGLPVVRSAGQAFCIADGYMAVAFDQVTAQPYWPTGVSSNPCGLKLPSDRLIFNSFFTQLSNFNDYYNQVGVGDYILFMTVRYNELNAADPTTVANLNDMGASPILTGLTMPGQVYYLLGRKGSGSAILENSASVNDVLANNVIIDGVFDRGRVISPKFGPNSTYEKLYVKHELQSVDDDVFYEVYGVRLDDTDSLIYTFTANTRDSLDLATLPGLNPANFPYLRVEAVTEDPLNLSAPQVKHLFITGEGVPEGSMRPALVGLSSYSIPDKEQGETFTINYAFQNISTRDFTEPLIVRFAVTNTITGQSTVDFDTLTALAAGDTVFFSHEFNTIGVPGENVIYAFVNPYLQPEQSYPNNVIVTNFYVDPDDLHPLMDVTFDGVHILDGDIVSPTPVISVTINDQNEYIYKSDTTGMELFLRPPCTNPHPVDGCPYYPVTLSDASRVQTYPATANSPYRIDYTPEGLTDGLYALRVQGTDALGNQAGTEPYEIRFEVINRSSVTNFYPYPNPFSTSCRFVFTLTGAQVPQEIKIQIMTVSGKVVREITQDEIGPIHIGNNMTDYAWDGRDEFGDQLANGVYFYRVFTRLNGQDIEHRATSADKAFKHEFGKLYLLR